MEVNPVTITQQPLLQDYYAQKQHVINKFSYNPFFEKTMNQRVHDIAKQTYDRNQLADILMDMNKNWNASEATFDNIESLRDPASVVVIGGQQAGLLSGPLYTINKLISIIVFAKEQRSALNIPVIPVFWIAGEDHDFDEIDHIMVPSINFNQMKKHRIKQRPDSKQSVSEMEIDHEQALVWIDELFSQMEETFYSKGLFELVVKQLNESDTYVDFFAKFIQELFTQEGLVLIDSGNEQVRKLESTFFKRLISYQPSISKGVYQQLQVANQQGYHVSVDVTESDGHLFYHQDGERILLMKETEDLWLGKNGECRLTTNELLDIAENTPERLSNNVVTRPLMQEWLFPTLAFMAGPGELSYWSVLKPAFETLGLAMPPIYPRLSLTLLDHKNEKFSEAFQLNVEEVLHQGLYEKKVNWLAMQQQPPLDPLVKQIMSSMEQLHQPLQEIAVKNNSNLESVASKNLAYIQEHVQFLQKKIEQEIENKNQIIIDKFNYLDLMIRPEQGLQERYWNIVYFINLYGFDWLSELINQTYSFNNNHYIIKL
ncbi:bacillithiol biosynthesis cysteine-adding enzyme BshC [Paraliobacillus salinarum]|uniref:bacillithiol biosynthesis cysteine-adding enzyme BshC n=1 Tax=Paraliobacillus salinarum TaxID=1158996 RepID=UPI0015F432FE|nr:bacillithiol biosynthesis cysteine-adding enzyme BshC [Paraliobacillus salinarum]